MHNNVGRNDSVPVPSIGLKRSVFSHALSPYTIVMNKIKKKCAQVPGERQTTLGIEPSHVCSLAISLVCENACLWF